MAIAQDHKINLRLRKADSSDAFFISSVRNDPEVIKNLHDPRMYSVEDCAKWLDNMGNNSERLIVYNDLEEKNIGVFRIDNIDQINHNCYVGLDISKLYRGQKLARPAYRLLFDYLFNKRNMNVLYLEHLDQGGSFLGDFYKSLGFRECGTFYNKVYRDGKPINSILMYLIKGKVA